jgi:hypothetical protein
VTLPLKTVLGLCAIFVAGAGTAALASWALATFGVRMRIDHDVAVQMPADMPVRVTIARPLSVRLADRIDAKVRIDELAIPIDEVIVVPLRMTLDVPIDTTVAVDEEIAVDLTVPLDIVLTEREIDLSKLEVTIDTDVFVDDQIVIDTIIPIDSEVTTTLGITVPVKMQVPVKAKIPIRQNVRIRDTIKLGMASVRIPLKMNVPVHASIPFKQELRVVGKVKVPISERIRVPIRQTMHPRLAEPLVASVELEGLVPATLDGELEARISFDEPVAAGLSSMHFDSGDVALERRNVTGVVAAVAPSARSQPR